MDVNEISGVVVHCAIAVHKNVGPGLMESVYEACLAYELRDYGFEVRQQVPMSVQYKGISLEKGFRMDLLVEDAVVVELKSIRQILPIHRAQLMTYLKLSNKRVGLLMNFNVKLMKHGLERFVNSRPEQKNMRTTE